MNRVILFTFLALLSCNARRGNLKLEKSKVLKVESEYIYGGLTNEKEYKIYTEKYVLLTRKRYNVGDTIMYYVGSRKL